MRRGDLVLIAAVLIAAGVLFALSRRESGTLTAVVYVGGERVGALALSGTREHVIEARGGQNTLLLEPDGVTMQRADCRSQDCVRTGKITRPGQVIACLPHRVMVVLEGKSPEGAAREGDVDAVTG